MMSYKDQTWCSRYASGECINRKCWLALTEDEKIKGRLWWKNSSFPISMGDRKTDVCGFMPKETHNG